MGWAAIGSALVAIGAPVGAGLALWGATSHLWGDDYFLAGFAASCGLTALGIYVLLAEFIGGIGPLRFPLPPTRHEREAEGHPEPSPKNGRSTRTRRVRGQQLLKRRDRQNAMNAAAAEPAARRRAQDDERSLSDADRDQIRHETAQRAVQTIHDPTLPALDESNKAAAQPKSEQLSPALPRETDRLVALYREGEQLRAKIFWSASSIVGDLIRGTANQRQVEREQLARDWDGRVLDALADDVRPTWIAAATLPEHRLDPASTIPGVREFLATKLVCLKGIIAESKADPTLGGSVELPSSLSSVEGEVPAGERNSAVRRGELLAGHIRRTHFQTRMHGSVGFMTGVAYDEAHALVRAWVDDVGITRPLPTPSQRTPTEADLFGLVLYVETQVAKLKEPG